jgi:spore coat protein SA
MPSTTYHLLTESEPFSEFLGGAVSRFAANVARGTSDSVVVCPSADETWGAAPGSIHLLPGMKFYKRFRRYLPHLPWFIHARVIRTIFRPVVKRLRPGDIVWIHNRPEFAVALTVPIHRSGSYVVLHLHNSHLANGPERLMRRVDVDHLVFISDFVMEEARQRFPSLGTCSVIYSGADETIFYPAADGSKNARPTILFAGRLVKEKGVHVLLDAMRLLEKQGVRAEALIVGSSGFGDGTDTHYIRQLKADVPASVRFCDYRSGAPLGELFRRADIFCSPSVWEEPFGMVNVEALASGLPVVSTRSGGAREIFAGGGGMLVERGSAVQLADALRLLIEDPQLRAHLGAQGRAAFRERFTWSTARIRVGQVQKALSGIGNAGAQAEPANLDGCRTILSRGTAKAHAPGCK